MKETKPIWKSKTFIGLFIALIGTTSWGQELFRGAEGGAISENILAYFGLGMAGYGRSAAKEKIG